MDAIRYEYRVRRVASVSTEYERGSSKRGYSDLSQVKGQDQGQGQDHWLLQRAALPQFPVPALILVLVLTLDQWTWPKSLNPRLLNPRLYTVEKWRTQF